MRLHGTRLKNNQLFSPITVPKTNTHPPYGTQYLCPIKLYCSHRARYKLASKIWPKIQKITLASFKAIVNPIKKKKKAPGSSSHTVTAEGAFISTWSSFRVCGLRQYKWLSRRWHHSCACAWESPFMARLWSNGMPVPFLQGACAGDVTSCI